MKLSTFMFINFLVAGIADVTLYDLAHNFGIYSELKPYYKNKSILYAAFLSALIVTLAVFPRCLVQADPPLLCAINRQGIPPSTVSSPIH